MMASNRSVPRFPVLLLFAVLGATMLNLAWAPHQLTFLAFLALVPFLLVASFFRQKPAAVFSALYAGFFVFHLTAAWWMYSSTLAGSLLAHLLNALLPAVALTLWGAITSRQARHIGKGLLLIALWIGMEWLNAAWPLAWPWFQLGHVFGSRPYWVQWYAVGSSAGGTVWVLTVNYLIFKLLSAPSSLRAILTAYVAIAIAIPALLSHLMPRARSTGEKLSIALVQPNIHPQREKFGGMDAAAQLSKATNLLGSLEPGSADYAIFPETMIVEPIEESEFDKSPQIGHLRQKIGEFKLKGIFTGAFTKRSIGWHPDDADKATAAGHVLYNSMLFITESDVRVYHKEKLVPLVEKQPFMWLIKPFRDFVESSGGFFGSYGNHNVQNVFLLDSLAVAVPLICFESAFACHPSDDQPLPAFMVLITNDGWWSTSGGYIQHLNLARLRAIERGQWMARAANTGISAFIDPEGNIFQQAGYDKEGVILADVPLSRKSAVACLVLDIIRLMSVSVLLVFLLFSLKNGLKAAKNQ